MIQRLLYDTSYRVLYVQAAIIVWNCIFNLYYTVYHLHFIYATQYIFQIMFIKIIC